jgi:Condensation domain
MNGFSFLENKQIESVSVASFVQRREWMIYKIRNDHYPFLFHRTLYIEDFNESLFKQAISYLLKKHEILRTTLKPNSGELYQLIHSVEEYCWDYTFYDVCNLEVNDREEFIKEKTIIQKATAFNFEFGPLFNIIIFKNLADQYLLSFTFHHVIFDAFSFKIFVKDAINISNKLIRGEIINITRPGIQYKDYSQFENDMLNGMQSKSKKGYWVSKLKKTIPRLELADKTAWEEFCADQHRCVSAVNIKLDNLEFCDKRFLGSVVRRYKGFNAGMVEFLFGESESGLINLFTRKTNCSLLALLVGSLSLSLNKLTSQTDFVFDIPVSSRPEQRFKDVIGWLTVGGLAYINVDLSKGAIQFIKSVDECLFELQNNVQFPFEAATEREEGRFPIGSMIPIFLNLIHEDEEHFQNLVQTSNIYKHQIQGLTTYQDMALFYTNYNNCIHLELAYNNSLFTPSIIEKLTHVNSSTLLEIVGN